jgi:alpha-1,6-mannosyltransferase
MMIQFLSRFFLMSFVAHGWFELAKGLDQRAKGTTTSSWFLLITACQFHMPFYASRMLPNVFSLVVVLHSFAAWMRGNILWAATGIVFGTVVFRCDLLLLLFSLGLSWLISKKLSTLMALKIGIATGIISLLLTVPIDSCLWQRFLWPEGEVFYYNTVLGKSSNWGTLPWHWYFSSAIPKSMLFTLLLVPFSSFRIVEHLVSWERWWRQSRKSSIMPLNQILDTRWWDFIVPTIVFVILYSCLGHKEMRFIFPAIPILNIGAAVGMARLSQLSFSPKKKTVTWVAILAFECGLLSIIFSLVGSLLFVAVSCWNYPGGDALIRLSQYIQGLSLSDNTRIHVYIDVASAMSGVSLFGQRAAQLSTPEVEWVFHKSGYEQEHALGKNAFDKFTYLLSETPDVSPKFRVVDTIQGNPSLNVRDSTIFTLDRLISTTDAIYILERIDWNNIH